MCRMTEVNELYKSTVFIFIKQNPTVQMYTNLTALILPEANENKLFNFIV